jgi:hypothetical protein
MTAPVSDVRFLIFAAQSESTYPIRAMELYPWFPAIDSYQVVL